MASSEEIAGLFPAMVERFVPEKAEGVEAVIQFDLSGDNGGKYWFKVSGGTAEAGEGEVEDAKMTLKAAADDWYAVATGETNAMQAFMTGKIKIQGDMGLAMKMQQFIAT